jgi:hypothetical protein
MLAVSQARSSARKMSCSEVKLKSMTYAPRK